MADFTILSSGEDVAVIDALVDNGRVLADADGVEAALGWTVKPEGLCRGDVCVPVWDDDGIEVDGRYDVGAVAAKLGMASLLDDASSMLALSAASADRHNALRGRVAPDFSLPDLDGRVHSLEQFKDRKRLLIAFASW